MTLLTHGRYDYVPLRGRRDYSWPDGKRLAVYFALNLEHFSFGEGLGAELSPGGPPPDVLNYAWRDWGNRGRRPARQSRWTGATRPAWGDRRHWSCRRYRGHGGARSSRRAWPGRPGRAYRGDGGDRLAGATGHPRPYRGNRAYRAAGTAWNRRQRQPRHRGHTARLTFAR